MMFGQFLPTRKVKQQMATTWFIQRNEKSVGPLSGQQLRELAVSGKLLGDDLVRKGDAVEFTPASRVKNLFADDTNISRPVPPPPRLPSAESQWQSSAATTSELSSDATPLADSDVIPPSASDDLQSPASSWPNRLLPYWTAGQNWLKEFGNQASQAGELGKLYALQARIQQIQLPQAYAALGTDVYSERRFADAFTTLFSEIDEAVSQQSALATPSSPERESDDLKGRVKSAADGVLRRGKGAQLGLKVRSLQNKLGEAVYVKHGKDCGPMQLIAPIEAAQQELQRLQQRIDDLAVANTGKMLTPKTLLVGGVCSLCLLAAYLFLFPRNHTPQATQAGPDNARVVAEGGSNGHPSYLWELSTEEKKQGWTLNRQEKVAPPVTAEMFRKLKTGSSLPSDKRSTYADRNADTLMSVAKTLGGESIKQLSQMGFGGFGGTDRWWKITQVYAGEVPGSIVILRFEQVRSEPANYMFLVSKHQRGLLGE
jgi:hypothetical protein